MLQLGPQNFNSAILDIQNSYCMNKLAHLSIIMPALRNEDAKPGILEHTILAPPPKTNFFSTNPNDGVELIMGEGDLEGAEPITVGQSLRAAMEKTPGGSALGYKEDGEWKYISYTEYYKLCISAAKSFRKVGIS